MSKTKTKTVPSIDEQIDNAIDKLIKEDWHYFLNVNYEKIYDCYGRDGCCKPYCRCGQIEDVSIEDTKDALHCCLSDKSRSLGVGIKDEILLYSFDRILRLSKVSFEPVIKSGYYGQELDSVKLTDDSKVKIKENLSVLKGLSHVDMIKKTLEMEYGYLLDSLDNKNKVSIQKISINSIKYNRDYCKKIDFSNSTYGEYYKFPRGVFVPSPDPVRPYRIVDGYHRVAKANEIGLRKINVIVLDCE